MIWAFVVAFDVDRGGVHADSGDHADSAAAEPVDQEPDPQQGRRNTSGLLDRGKMHRPGGDHHAEGAE
jgi:hypothetical protein